MLSCIATARSVVCGMFSTIETYNGRKEAISHPSSADRVHGDDSELFQLFKLFRAFYR